MEGLFYGLARTILEIKDSNVNLSRTLSPLISPLQARDSYEVPRNIVTKLLVGKLCLSSLRSQYIPCLTANCIR